MPPKRKARDEESEDGSEIERIPIPPKPRPDRTGPPGIIYAFTIEFLKDLIANNNRDWMNLNRARYEASKENFLELVAVCLQELSKIDSNLSEFKPKDTIYRINRDVRFSIDKSPYKNHFGAFFAKGGKKSKFAGLYIHVSPEQTLVGGGIYQADSATLESLRQQIDRDPSALIECVKSDEMKRFFGEDPLKKLLETEDKLKTKPKNYPKDHEHIELLKLKSFVFGYKFKREQVLQNDFPSKVVDCLIALNPFVQVLNSWV